VSENFLEGIEVPAIHHPLGRERVPEIVEVKVAKPGASSGISESLLDPGESSTVRVSKDVVRIERARKSIQNLSHGRVHSDVARLTILGIPDSEETGCDVSISPLQTQDFPHSHSGVHRDRRNGSHVW
jgi:hypothetical protein